MKKIFFIVFVSLSSNPTVAQTNVYHPFPDSNAVWSISYSINNTMCTDNGHYKYTLAGDTVIGIYIYKRVVPAPINYFNPCGGIFSGSGITTFVIRQDTVAKKVYSIYNGQDTLLYDFSLTIGDTMRSILTCGSYGVVQSIDSILIGTQYRRKINFLQPLCNLNQSFIVEGIGSNYGLFEVFLNWTELSHCLACFKLNNDMFSLLSSSMCHQCSDIPTNTMDEVKISDDLIVSPNPFNDYINLGFNEIENAIELNISNIFGESVYHVNFSLSTKSKTIYLPQAKNGVYFLKIRTSEKIIIKKIIRYD